MNQFAPPFRHAAHRKLTRLERFEQDLMACGEVHPALCNWLFRRVEARPEITSALVFAMIIMVWHLERPMVDPADAFELYLEGFLAQRGGRSVEPLGQDDFKEAFASMAADHYIARALGREPLIVEHDATGRIRRELWSAGLREPDVSLHMIKLGLV
jgi:hypothetical protein